MISTSDIVDAQGGEVNSCDTQFRQFGGRRTFTGSIRTVLCHDDNALVKQALSEPGEGLVLVIDGGASLHTALVGDKMAGIAAANGWVGIVVYGAIRDGVEINTLDIGLKALGTNPRKSATSGAGKRDNAVSFGGVTFAPGSKLFSDDDGLVVTA